MKILATLSAAKLLTGVARWFIFKPKIQIWVYFGVPWNVVPMLLYFIITWNILRSFVIHNLWLNGILCGLVYFPHFGMFGPERSGNPA
jgi:hypothetical protein